MQDLPSMATIVAAVLLVGNIIFRMTRMELSQLIGTNDADEATAGAAELVRMSTYLTDRYTAYPGSQHMNAIHIRLKLWAAH